MRQTLLFLVFGASAFGQQSFDTLNILPGGAARFYNSAGTFYTGIEAPSSIGANQLFKWPARDGPAGACMATDGAGNLGLTGVCGLAALTPPVTISGSTSSPILTLDNTGSGAGLTIAATTDPELILDHPINGSTALQIGSTAVAQILGNGIGYFQGLTARYLFNSIGDVPSTGTVNVSGTTVTWASGVVFDISWAGGQILICPGACTGTNGSLYLISAFVSSTQLTLATSAGTLTGAGYSYQANAFQTSTGTMYITGTGFGYLQNVVVTDGFTSYAAGSASGTVSCVGAACTWLTGTLYNLSMQGGTVAINGVDYTVSSVGTPTQFTLTTSVAGGSVTNVSFSYTSYPFLISNGNAYINGSGLGFFNGGIATGPSSDSLIYVGSTGNFYNRTFTGGGGPSCTGVGDGWQGVNTSTPGLWFCAGGVAYSASGSGVASFNTRTGAVTLSKADVTAVDQALGTGDSPNFSSLTLSNVLFALGVSTSGIISGGALDGTSLTLSSGGSINIGGAYGISSSGALTVSSCTGCGSGAVSSFNTRTGAVTLSKADVTAVDQALGTGDSPTFANLNLNAGSNLEFQTNYSGGTVNNLKLLDSVGSPLMTWDVQNSDVISNVGFGVGTGGSPQSLDVSGTSTLTGAVTIGNTLAVIGDLTEQGQIIIGTGSQVGALIPYSLFNIIDFHATSANTGIDIASNGTGIVQIGGASILLDTAVTFSSSLSGTHAQNLGTGDSPTFNVVSVSGCAGCGGVTSFNTRTGSVSLAKADVTAVDQALGTGDAPTFGGLTVNGTASINGNTTFGSGSNTYMRSFSGTPSCSGVANGWFGFDTASGVLYICNGGVATTH